MAAKNSTKNKKSPEKPSQNQTPPLFKSQKKQYFLVVVFAFAVLMGAVVLIDADGLWGSFRNFFFGMFGVGAFIIPFFLVFVSCAVAFGRDSRKFKYSVIEGVILFTLVMSFIDIIQTDEKFTYSAQIALAYNRFKTFSGDGIKYGTGVTGALFGGIPLLITDGNKLAAGVINGVLLFVLFMIFSGTTLVKLFHSLKPKAEAVAEYAGEKAEDIKETYETVAEDINEHKAKVSEKRRIKRDEKLKNNGYLLDIPLDDKPSVDMGIDAVLNKRAPAFEKTGTDKNISLSNKPDNEKIELMKSFEDAPVKNAPPLDEIFKKKIPVDNDGEKEEKTAQPVKEEKKKSSSVSKKETELAAKEIEKEIAENPVAEKNYALPPLDCLNKPKNSGNVDNTDELRERAEKIVSTLKSFGVGTHIVDICRSPSVTRFELQPDPGVKISRITALTDDISMNLAASGVRIEAPIPNKNAVGIEVPNPEKTMVTLREIIDTPAYKNAKSKLNVALGRDIQGEPTYCDIAKMPHLLVAGTTGSGKSVCLNSMIVSILYNATPDEVKLVLVDPKKVEFTMYQGIPHLLIPVVSDPRKAAGALSWAVAEMDKRYALFAENGVRNIQGYNSLVAGTEGMTKMPQIVIVIDEFSDLMMVASNEVEELVCRLAQKARAAGMHLIVATQRPSVDVITGLIKANIPSRIALSVKSQIDSRTIIDIQGAEKLLGNGDMLYCPVGLSKPLRVQGAYLSDEEIENVIEYVKTQGDASYDDSVIREIEEKAAREDNKKKGGASVDSGASPEYDDEMVPKAIEVVVEAGMASTTLLQRKLKLGYARAARIVDELSEKGIIGPYEGSKPRKVLITKDQWFEMQATSSSFAPVQLSVEDMETSSQDNFFEEEKQEEYEEHNYFGSAVNNSFEEDEV